MISLNGYLHREELGAIVGRWLVNRPQSGDAHALKRIVNFNGYGGCLILDAFAQSLLSSVHERAVRSFAVRAKGELKDFIVGAPATVVTRRVEELIARYRQDPDGYFRETPFNGRIYHDGSYLGSARVKRFHRIAEKTSRYLIDYLFREVQTAAEALAARRAAQLGVPTARLNTPVDEQVAEFVRAERDVLDVIRSGSLVGTPALNVNDVLGVKLVVDGPGGVDRVLGRLEDDPGLALVERQEHAGAYNATSLLVRYRWPRDLLRDRPPTREALEILRARGCSCDVESVYRRFVEEAEDDVLIEVIVSSYEEMLESEIGRSMHEERTIAQRERRQYHSSPARNIEALIDFMFRFCLSRVEDLPELPFRLWVRYMPDHVDEVLMRLGALSPETDFARVCDCGGASRGERPARE